MHRRPTAALAMALLLATSASAQRAQHVDTAALQRILIAEDSRATGPALQPVLAASTSSDTLLRRVSVRALGRLQRPELLPRLITALADKTPAVRAEAATAIAQALINIRRSTADPRQGSVRTAADALIRSLTTESHPAAAGAISEALGRLPYGDSAGAKRAAAALTAHPSRTFDGVRGLYWLALYRRTNPLPPAVVTALHADWLGKDAPARRVAYLALSLIDGLDSATLVSGSHDPDPQVRRLALAGLAGLDAATRTALLQRALADTSAIVRIGAIAAFRLGNATPDCTPLIAAISDRNAHVSIAAIDALGGACADGAAARAALEAAIANATSNPTHRSIPMQAHAIEALAHQHVAPAATAMQSSSWLIRLAGARGAAMVVDTTALFRLSRDVDNNVREAAVVGLAKVMKHEADSSYIAALTSSGYQVVLAAATALAGSHDVRAMPAMFDALDRLTALRSENTRDPRIGILKALPAAATGADADRLRPYLADFDTAVAATAATIITRWTGTPTIAHAVLLPIVPQPLARVFLARNVRLRVTMAKWAGGGVFTVRLFTDDAPATAARIINLVRAHYYDGHAFQRVEPNFVVQGGGGDASEYVGDALFMRDELSRRSHARATIGISTRGRDTGDGQWFINLTDNTRLDHEYTVMGEVISGQRVAEGILEGDRIQRVDVVGAP